MSAGAIHRDSASAAAVAVTGPMGANDTPSGPRVSPAGRERVMRRGFRGIFLRRRLARLLMPAGVLVTFVVLCVALEVLERRVFSGLSIAWHHGLLTAWAGLLTIVACGIVYLPMRRQQRRLSQTAEQLASILDRYQANPSGGYRFENPHLMHCQEVVECGQQDCPMRHTPRERCWQEMALRRAPGDHVAPRIEIQKCMECPVYRLSCPDKITELGESFNNLMFLLEDGAEQFGRLRAQMVEKEKMSAIGQIAAGIAHEVGNPLSSISSIVQMLKRGRASGSMTEELDLIETHIQRISAIVRQLVTMARPIVEGWDLIDLGEILEEAVRLISFDRRAREVQIDFKRPHSLSHSYGLRGALQQVFINLSLNALDAMPKGGKLTIRVEGARGSNVVRFQDTGEGIPLEIGRRVFEPFFTTKEPGAGTGLGLSVSYGIVQKHGGTIDFNSTAREGTVFTVTLPVWEKAPEADHAKDHDPTGG